jgi:hypothetical protein
MADLSAAAPLRFRWDSEMFIEKWVCDNSAAATWYRGAPAILDISEDTLYVRPYSSSVTLANGDGVVGICLEDKTVLATDTETSNVIEVAGPGSVVGFKTTAVTNADVGKAVGLTGSATLGAVVITGLATACPLGYLLRVEDGYAYVKLLDRPVIISGL